MSEAAAATGDMETALALAERAVAIGTGAADADLKAYALTNLGALKIASGATSDGLALMEEASIAAVNFGSRGGSAPTCPSSTTHSTDL